MHINWWTLALQTINVLVLVWLMSRFLYRPIVAAIAGRQAEADKLLADAATASGAAKLQEAALKASNDSFAADEERQRVATKAAADADRTHLLDQVRQEIADLHRAAASAAEDDRKQAGAALEVQAASLAGHMAEKLLARLPAETTTAAMFGALLDQLAKLPSADGKQLANGALQVVTPATLADEDRARYEQALAEALPGLSKPVFLVEPELIAGFEVRGTQMILRNSWRADLDDLLHVLREDAHARIT